MHMKVSKIKILMRIGLIFPLFLFLFSCGKGLYVLGGNDDPEKVDSIRLKVYLENSGSMDGYMINRSEFKDAVYDFVNSIDACEVVDTTELYFINSQLIPFHQKIDDYVLNMNPTSFKQYGGSRANTDLADVISKVISNSKNSDVSLLISDFIWDVPIGSIDMNSSKIRTTIQKKLKNQSDFSVYILQLESRFVGFNGNKAEIKRPYYIWMFGSKSALSNIFKKVRPTQIKHGLKDNHIAVFAPERKVGWQLSSGAQVQQLKTTRGGYYSFNINAALDNSLLPSEYVSSVANYEVRKGDVTKIRLDGITPIVKSNSKYSHVLSVSIKDNFSPSMVEIALICDSMPKWVKESNQEMKTGVKYDPDKTMGILNLVQGVSEAYHDYKYSTTFCFTLSKRGKPNK